MEWATSNCVVEVKTNQLVKSQRSVPFFCFCFYYFDCTSRGCSKLKHLSRAHGFWDVIRLNYPHCKEKYTIKIWTKPCEIPAWCKSLFIYPARKLKKSNLCLHFYAAYFTFYIRPHHCCTFRVPMTSYQVLTFWWSPWYQTVEAINK